MAVVGIAHGLAVGLRDGDQTAGVVTLVEGVALCRGDSSEKSQLVVGIRLRLFARVVRRQDIARAVVGDEKKGSGCDWLLAPWCLFGYLIRTHGTVPYVLVSVFTIAVDRCRKQMTSSK